MCKCDGEYYFRDVSTSISRSRKAKDYEHAPALEQLLLNAHWFKLIENGENSSDEEAVVEAIRKRGRR